MDEEENIDMKEENQKIDRIEEKKESIKKCTERFDQLRTSSKEQRT